VGLGGFLGFGEAFVWGRISAGFIRDGIGFFFRLQGSVEGNTLYHV
jgi:hypothetical protein